MSDKPIDWIVLAELQDRGRFPGPDEILQAIRDATREGVENYLRMYGMPK